MYKVLIADDEQYMLEGLKMMIDWKARGFEICACAESGDEALEMFERYQPDFVLLDICMPVYTGVEIAKILRERGYENDIAMLTGYNETDFARQAIKYRVKYYFNKPVNPHEIEEALDEIRAALDKKKILNAEYMENLVFDEAIMEKLKAGADIDFTGMIELADNIVSCIKNRDAAGIEKNIDGAISKSAKYEEAESVMNIFSAYLETRILQLLPKKNAPPGGGVRERDFVINDTVWEIKPALMDMCMRAINAVKETAPVPDTNVENIERYLKEHYKEEIVIKNLANIFHMNHVYLGVVFSKKTGMGIKKYVHSLRMKEVDRLIRETDMSLKDIAIEVGYSNYNNFFNWFEKIFGTTPEEYRKKLKINGGN